ncbi:tRNA (adenosine(37)-N6)-threonylcarbamoyltransferase complex ATPase subunit type 1 TsaE [Cucumibacter marinus]|uniref:tRNA (adenosine(37)-N6)-threonylcarbamoyltransferase complex ATPase subunit type 1 TsaE n=1 Tax=Cucumibacter marinus TaxID=1121252 RepID=UPI000408076E|nr:tRNA (adenosine(37)-N6)-threonylcarbamoyltransferase complex ATPase subunit type 1 TsaE [Cucumibacter marinus]
MFCVILAGEAQTAALAAALVPHLSSGERILLEGGLGAGKSSFARALIRQLAGDPELDVPSPTFALVQPYDTPAGPVIHADLYRLGDPDEAIELGLFEDRSALLIVEWPERLPGLFDEPHWVIRFDLASDPAARRTDIIPPPTTDRDRLARSLAGFPPPV